MRSTPGARRACRMFQALRSQFSELRADQCPLIRTASAMLEAVAWRG